MLDAKTSAVQHPQTNLAGLETLTIAVAAWA
jgi:hypothetical protein